MVDGFGSAWVSPLSFDDGGRWFDGYVGQPLAIFDEFDGRFGGWRLAPLLRVIDRYSLLVPVKGGYTWWEPEEIRITTNFHPSEWFDYSERREQYKALRRRVTTVVQWRDDGNDGFDRRQLTPDEPEAWGIFWRPLKPRGGYWIRDDKFAVENEVDKYNWSD